MRHLPALYLRFTLTESKLKVNRKAKHVTPPIRNDLVNLFTQSLKFKMHRLHLLDRVGMLNRALTPNRQKRTTRIYKYRRHRNVGTSKLTTVFDSNCFLQLNLFLNLMNVNKFQTMTWFWMNCISLKESKYLWIQKTFTMRSTMKCEKNLLFHTTYVRISEVLIITR